jgi:hypothetical protein
MAVPGDVDHVKFVGTATPVAALAGDVKVTAAVAPLEIFNVTVLTLVPETLFPVIVNVYEPGAAEPVFEIVNTLVPAGVTGLTEKFDVAPAGTPLTDNVTGLL